MEYKILQRTDPGLKWKKPHLDISSREVVLGHDELLQVDIYSQSHPAGVYVKYASLGFLVRQRELNFAIDPSWANQSWIKCLNSIGGHHHLYVPPRIKPIQ